MPAAEAVERIRAMVQEGMSDEEIAARLNEAGAITGALGKTRSTSVAASLHIRRAAQLGQGLRCLHEKATSTSWPQPSE